MSFVLKSVCLRPAFQVCVSVVVEFVHECI